MLVAHNVQNIWKHACPSVSLIFLGEKFKQTDENIIKISSLFKTLHDF